MKPELHKAAMQGSVASLQLLVKKDPNILSSKTPQENTALHIAAGLGHTDFAREVIAMDGHLLVSKNDDGDTPLHLAARSGKLDVAELLINVIRLDQACLKEERLMMTNKEGNTPLHVAVKHRRSALALKLLEAEPSRGHTLNAKNQSPMHIAAREGLVDVVAKIVEQPWVPEEFKPSDSVSGTALHQAVLGGHTRVVEILLKQPGLIDLTDSSGDNALHYAAQKDDARMVKMLLNHKSDLAYERNRERQMSPLHVAANYGSTKAMKELLIQCPDVAELLDSAGRNAVHTAVTSGKVDALKCLLHHVRPEEVVNRADTHGNTPLHLAAKMARIRSALMLLKDSRVNPCLLNRDGHTARSLVEESAAAEEMDTYVMYLWKQLKKHEASRCKNHQLPPVATYRSLRSRKASGHDEYFELSVGTYTLVATLIATVTFAATFTMPGGYNQVEGTAIHGHRAAFKIFVISNTVAMCSSIVVVFCFIWAWRDPVKFKLDQLMWGHRLTVVACLAMVVSLMTAVYITVVPTARWPAYVVIVIGASTPAVVFLILGKEALYVPL